MNVKGQWDRKKSDQSNLVSMQRKTCPECLPHLQKLPKDILDKTFPSPNHHANGSRVKAEEENIDGNSIKLVEIHNIGIFFSPSELYPM